MILMKVILVGCHGKSLIAVDSRENGGKEIGNCMYRQILWKNITVNEEKRHEMIAGGKSKTKWIFLLFLRWRKNTFFYTNGNNTEKRRLCISICQGL